MVRPTRKREWTPGLLWPWLYALLGLALRLPRLDRSLWHDEIVTVTLFAGCPIGHLLSFYPYPNNHILHSLLLKPLLLAGDAEWLIRIPALAAGVATIPLLYRLAIRHFGVRVAHVASLLLAVAPMHVGYSMQARGYTLVALGAVLALDGFWSWLPMARATRRARRAAIGGAVAAAWAVPGAVWLIFGLAGAAVWTSLRMRAPARRRRLWTRGATLLGACGLLLLALYAPVLRQMLAYARTQHLAAGESYWAQALALAGALPAEIFRGWPVPIVTAATVLGLGLCMARPGRRLHGRTLFLAWFVPIAVAPLATGGEPPRLFLYLLPLSLLMVAVLIEFLLAGARRGGLAACTWLAGSRARGVGCALALGLLGWGAASLVLGVWPRPTAFVTGGPEEDWREAAALLSRELDPGQAAAAWSLEKRIGVVNVGMGYYLPRAWDERSRREQRPVARQLLVALREGAELQFTMRLALLRDIWQPDPGPEFERRYIAERIPHAVIRQVRERAVCRIYDLDVALPGKTSGGAQPETLWTLRPGDWQRRPIGDSAPASATEEVLPTVGSALRVTAGGAAQLAGLRPELVMVPSGNSLVLAWALVEMDGGRLDSWYPEEIVSRRREEPVLFGRRLTERPPPPVNRLELTLFNESRDFPYRAQLRLEVESNHFLYLLWGDVEEHERLTPLFAFSAGERGYSVALREFAVRTEPGPTAPATASDQER